MPINHNFETKITKENESKVLFRLKRNKTITAKRLKTNTAFDDVSGGGLPFGLTILIGDPGTGKSRFSQEMARSVVKSGGIALYVYAESTIDLETLLRGLNDEQLNRMQTADFLSYLPKWADALEQIKFLLNYTKADLLVVDSLTTLFSNTTKAVEEADVRSAIFDLKQQLAGKVPIIGISQIRGQGMFTYPAGGRAVDHASDMNIEFEILNAKLTENNKIVKSMTDRLYTIEITKDKYGQSYTAHKLMVEYVPNIKFTKISD